MLKTILTLGTIASVGTAGYLASAHTQAIDQPTHAIKDTSSIAEKTSPSSSQQSLLSKSQRAFKIESNRASASKNVAKMETTPDNHSMSTSKSNIQTGIFSMSIDGYEGDEELSGVLDESMKDMMQFMKECHEIYADKHHGNPPAVDSIRLKTRLKKDSSIGAVAVKTEIVSANEVSMDDDFRECIQENSLAMQIPADHFKGEETTINLGMNFDLDPIAKNGIKDCFKKLKTMEDTLDEEHIRNEMRDCLEGFAESSGAVVSTTIQSKKNDGEETFTMNLELDDDMCADIDAKDEPSQMKKCIKDALAAKLNVEVPANIFQF